jgi:hypothetical protein
MPQKFNSKIYSIIKAVLFRAAFFMELGFGRRAFGRRAVGCGQTATGNGLLELRIIKSNYLLALIRD